MGRTDLQHRADRIAIRIRVVRQHTARPTGQRRATMPPSITVALSSQALGAAPAATAGATGTSATATSAATVVRGGSHDLSSGRATPGTERDW